MEKGTRIIYKSFGLNKSGVVVFSCRSSAGIIYNDIKFDEGGYKLNVYDDELEVEELQNEV